MEKKEENRKRIKGYKEKRKRKKRKGLTWEASMIHLKEGVRLLDGGDILPGTSLTLTLEERSSEVPEVSPLSCSLSIIDRMFLFISTHCFSIESVCTFSWQPPLWYVQRNIECA